MPYKTLYFDLDDTLYPPQSGLWDAIRDRMNEYMKNFVDLPLPEIVSLCQRYLEEYGTTLRGLQAHYEVDVEDYLAYVHDLPLEKYINPDPPLKEVLLSLPQKRWIFTNSDIKHARRVLNILGFADCFNGIIDIHAIDFACKPDKIAYQKALSVTQEDHASDCVIFDDALRNLAPARELGFYTVLVGKNSADPVVDRAILSLNELRDCFPELWTNGN
jgi:putative hydrolase of the HAD superfamily